MAAFPASRDRPTLLGLPDTLRLRLALFSAALALPLLVLLGFGIERKFDNDHAAALERLHAQRVTAERILKNYLDRLRFKLNELEALAGFEDLAAASTKDHCAQFLRLHPEIINVAVLDRSGSLRFSTAFPVTDPPQNYRSMPNMADIIAANSFVVSRAAPGKTTGRWGCVAALPLRAHPDLLLAAPVDLLVKWTPKVGQRGTVLINQMKGTVRHVPQTTPA